VVARPAFWQAGCTIEAKVRDTGGKKNGFPLGEEASIVIQYQHTRKRKHATTNRVDNSKKICSDLHVRTTTVEDLLERCCPPVGLL